MRFYQHILGGNTNLPISEKETRRVAQLYRRHGRTPSSPVLYVDAPEYNCTFLVKANKKKVPSERNNDYADKITSVYIKKELIQQVVHLFRDNVAIRDDRFATVNTIVNTHYRGWFGNNIGVTAKLIFDIDRAFRYVQQHIPELRGKTWVARQKRGGEPVNDEDADIKALKAISKQLKLKFE